MGRESIRKNAVLLKWARAVAFFAVMYLALRVLPFYPVPVRLGLAAACSALGFVAPAVGVLVFVVATALPLVAADFLGGGSSCWSASRPCSTWDRMTPACSSSSLSRSWQPS